MGNEKGLDIEKCRKNPKKYGTLIRASNGTLTMYPKKYSKILHRSAFLKRRWLVRPTGDGTLPCPACRKPKISITYGGKWFCVACGAVYSDRQYSFYLEVSWNDKETIDIRVKEIMDAHDEHRKLKTMKI